MKFFDEFCVELNDNNFPAEKKLDDVVMIMFNFQVRNCHDTVNLIHSFLYSYIKWSTT